MAELIIQIRTALIGAFPLLLSCFDRMECLENAHSLVPFCVGIVLVMTAVVAIDIWTVSIVLLFGSGKPTICT